MSVGNYDVSFKLIILATLYSVYLQKHVKVSKRTNLIKIYIIPHTTQQYLILEFQLQYNKNTSPRLKSSNHQSTV